MQYYNFFLLLQRRSQQHGFIAENTLSGRIVIPFKVYFKVSNDNQCFQGDRQPNNATTSGNFFQLLVIGTALGSVHILQLCPDNIQNSLTIPYAMIKCKCHYVASIALQIAMLDSESHSDVSAYIFIGGFNGEIEVISYGQLPDENDGAFGMQSTKVITTLWKNSKWR